MTRPPSIALLYWESEVNATLSYQHGWPRAFIGSPLFETLAFNMARATFQDWHSLFAKLRGASIDAIVMLHSVFSNERRLKRIPYWLMARCPQPKVYFIGNEYKSMPDKVRFAKELGVSLLVSQSTDERVLDMYRAALGCQAIGIPNTGCDLSVFRPVTPLGARDIDIGYRSLEAPWYLGNNDKTEIADFFVANAPRLGLTTDISLQESDRFDMVGYAAFLNRCRGQIGTESGGDYFELTDELRTRVLSYMKAHPGITWPELKAIFFNTPPTGVPMRIISGRQVEAAACKTAQILFEGRYDGFMAADTHYIPLAKDFSNIDDVVRKFRDDAYCQRIADNAYDMVAEQLTYDRLLGRLSSALAQIL